MSLCKIVTWKVIDDAEFRLQRFIDFLFIFSVLPLEKMGTGSNTMFLTTCATATNCQENVMDRWFKHRVPFVKFPPFSKRPTEPKDQSLAGGYSSLGLWPRGWSADPVCLRLRTEFGRCTSRPGVSMRAGVPVAPPCQRGFGPANTHRTKSYAPWGFLARQRKQSGAQHFLIDCKFNVQQKHKDILLELLEEIAKEHLRHVLAK